MNDSLHNNTVDVTKLPKALQLVVQFLNTLSDFKPFHLVEQPVEEVNISKHACWIATQEYSHEGHVVLQFPWPTMMEAALHRLKKKFGEHAIKKGTFKLAPKWENKLLVILNEITIPSNSETTAQRVVQAAVSNVNSTHTTNSQNNEGTTQTSADATTATTVYPLITDAQAIAGTMADARNLLKKKDIVIKMAMTPQGKYTSVLHFSSGLRCAYLHFLDKSVARQAFLILQAGLPRPVYLFKEEYVIVAFDPEWCAANTANLLDGCSKPKPAKTGKRGCKPGSSNKVKGTGATNDVGVVVTSTTDSNTNNTAKVEKVLNPDEELLRSVRRRFSAEGLIGANGAVNTEANTGEYYYPATFSRNTCAILYRFKNEELAQKAEGIITAQFPDVQYKRITTGIFFVFDADVFEKVSDGFLQEAIAGNKRLPLKSADKQVRKEKVAAAPVVKDEVPAVTTSATVADTNTKGTEVVVKDAFKQIGKGTPLQIVSATTISLISEICRENGIELHKVNVEKLAGDRVKVTYTPADYADLSTRLAEKLRSYGIGE